MKLRPFSTEEWEILPHVFMTQDSEWNPNVLDHELTSDETFFDAKESHETLFEDVPFDARGELKPDVETILDDDSSEGEEEGNQVRPR